MGKSWRHIGAIYLKHTGYIECTIKTERLQRNRCLENAISIEEY